MRKVFSHPSPSEPSLISLSSSATGLGGCIRALSVQNDGTSPPAGQSVNLFLASRRAARVYLDGCPTSESRYNCRGNDSVLVYSGKRTRAADYSLQPFTGNTHKMHNAGNSGNPLKRDTTNTGCREMALLSLFSSFQRQRFVLVDFLLTEQ